MKVVPISSGCIYFIVLVLISIALLVFGWAVWGWIGLLFAFIIDVMMWAGATETVR